MRKYRLVAKKGEGTFSEVLKAQNVKDGKYHAIKCMKNRFESIDQVNNLREIQALRRLSPHEHIITLEEVLYDQPTGRLALVFELMDANLYELIRGLFSSLLPYLLVFAAVLLQLYSIRARPTHTSSLLPPYAPLSTPPNLQAGATT
jgi:renal tumor antigen